MFHYIIAHYYTLEISYENYYSFSFFYEHHAYRI